MKNGGNIENSIHDDHSDRIKSIILIRFVLFRFPFAQICVMFYSVLDILHFYSTIGHRKIRQMVEFIWILLRTVASMITVKIKPLHLLFFLTQQTLRWTPVCVSEVNVTCNASGYIFSDNVSATWNIESCENVSQKTVITDEMKH